MGFYVGSALKSLTCICLNKNKCFKRKSLLGDTRLACLHLNVGGKYSVDGRTALPSFQKTGCGVLNTLILSSSSDKGAFSSLLSL